MSRRILPSICCLLWACLGTVACTQKQVIVANATPTKTASEPVPDEQRLAVAIVVFDPGLGEEPDDVRVLPAVRQAETRFMASTLRETLDRTGFWSEVRVVPEPVESADVLLTGSVVRSDGLKLSLSVDARDATGRLWFEDTFVGLASKYSYRPERLGSEDPFQSVYNDIADRMATALAALPKSELRRIRLTAEMRFAGELVPDPFASYLSPSEEGRWTVVRLPADDDPMLARVREVQERDRALLRALDGHYRETRGEVKEAYDGLRKASYEEALALERAERSARNNMVLGTVALVAGAAGAAGSNSSLAQAAGAASAVGGIAVVRRGMQQSEQAELHREALEELEASFAREVEPRVVRLEGRVITLRGSAREQYREWRALLKRIYETETGVMDEDPPRPPE